MARSNEISGDDVVTDLRELGLGWRSLWGVLAGGVLTLAVILTLPLKISISFVIALILVRLVMARRGYEVLGTEVVMEMRKIRWRPHFWGALALTIILLNISPEIATIPFAIAFVLGKLVVRDIWRSIPPSTRMTWPAVLILSWPIALLVALGAMIVLSW